MIKMIYDGEDALAVNEEVKQAFDFVYKKFLIEIPSVIVSVHKSRADFDKRLKRETPQWLVANAFGNERIEILCPEALENDSSHDRSEFSQILRHEFTHLFIDKIASGSFVPKWLNEGIANYIAGKPRKMNISVEEGFCEKMSSPSGWNTSVSHGAYDVSLMFVYYLIAEFSFAKIKELIISLEKDFDFRRFEKIFLKVFNKNLSDMERSFIMSLKN